MKNQHERRWVVDDCPDAQGYWTIRLADGTPHGDTEACPVATVYLLADADAIVAAINRQSEMTQPAPQRFLRAARATDAGAGD